MENKIDDALLDELQAKLSSASNRTDALNDGDLEAIVDDLTTQRGNKAWLLKLGC